jgi:rRNA-processing protein FCF1
MKVKVIFDTNIIKDTNPESFLGGRVELQKFAEIAEIILPDLVIEELKCQKRKELEKNKGLFLKNPFHWLRNINQEDTENFDNEAHITELENKEDIKYTIIHLKNHSVLDQIRELAIKELPPFQTGGKGFKDTYIYFTILEYLQTIPDKYVFVCTKDKVFQTALQKHPNIKVIENFEEFEKNIGLNIPSDYILQQIQETYEGIEYEEKWLNIENNWVLSFKEKSQKRLIIFDSVANETIGTIVTTQDLNIVLAYLNEDKSYNDMGEFIKELQKYYLFFSKDHFIQILHSSMDNYCIYNSTIANKEIVKIFRRDENIKEFLNITDDLWEQFAKKYNLNHNIT